MNSRGKYIFLSCIFPRISAKNWLQISVIPAFYMLPFRGAPLPLPPTIDAVVFVISIPMRDMWIYSFVVGSVRIFACMKAKVLLIFYCRLHAPAIDWLHSHMTEQHMHLSHGKHWSVLWHLHWWMWRKKNVL